MKKLHKAKQGFTFDDVLLIPKLSTVGSRSDVDLSIDLGKGIKLKIPVVSANMKHVTGLTMARAITNLGGLALLHRFCKPEEQLNTFKQCDPNHVGCSIGASTEDIDLVSMFADAGCKIICIDVAHGHHIKVLNIIEKIAAKYSSLLIIAGNVATRDAAKDLTTAGANVIKCGIGPGSLCSTRIETGNGVPQLTALEDVKDGISWNPSVKLIADGGIRKAGDIVKSLVYADAVMLGSLLAGTNESPGKIIDVDGRKYKEYEGSSTFKNKNIEGVKAWVNYTGSVDSVMENLMDGLRSGCSYQGARSLKELKEAEFILISNAGLNESHPHSNIIR